MKHRQQVIDIDGIDDRHDWDDVVDLTEDDTNPNRDTTGDLSDDIDNESVGNDRKRKRNFEYMNSNVRNSNINMHILNFNIAFTACTK
jgi:hypothetical protein